MIVTPPHVSDHSTSPCHEPPSQVTSEETGVPSNMEYDSEGWKPYSQGAIGDEEDGVARGQAAATADDDVREEVCAVEADVPVS